MIILMYVRYLFVLIAMIMVFNIVDIVEFNQIHYGSLGNFLSAVGFIIMWGLSGAIDFVEKQYTYQ